MAEFIMSRHAVQQALAMCVEGEEIREAVLNPRSVNNPPGRGVAYMTRGRVTAVVSHSAPPTVITVLWASMNSWALDHETIHSRGDGGMDKYQQAAKAQRRLIKARKKGRVS